MLSRKSLLLRSYVQRLGQKSSSQAPLSASFAARQQKDAREKASGHASGAIHKMLSKYMSAASHRNRLYNKRGQVTRPEDYVASRTAPLPTQLLSETGSSERGMVGGQGERMLSDPEAEMRKSEKRLTKIRKLSALGNPLREAAAAAENLANNEKITTFDAPWIAIEEKNRRKFMGTKGAAAAVGATGMYTQNQLENHFGDDPLDQIVTNIQEDVLRDLHASTPHPLYTSSLDNLRWTSMKRMSFAPVLYRPLTRNRYQPQQKTERRQKDENITVEGEKTKTLENRERSKAFWTSITPRRVAHSALLNQSNVQKNQQFGEDRKSQNSKASDEARSRVFDKSQNSAVSQNNISNRLSKSSSFHGKKLLKIPSWPLATLVLDANSSRNPVFVNIPQRWHDAATGDSASAEALNTTTPRGEQENIPLESAFSKLAPDESLRSSVNNNLTHVTSKALEYINSIERSAILAQSPTSTLYQLQVVASLGVPLVGIDELLIAAALDHWHSFGAHSFSNNFAGSATEQLVVLRCVFHIALARAASELGLVQKGRRVDSTLGAEEDSIDPIASDEAIAAAGQFLLRHNPTFPKKLSQSVPKMLKWFASRGLFLDFLEVQWHWTLWMGGGIPDVNILENLNSFSSSSSLSKFDDQKKETDYWSAISSAGELSSALVNGDESSRRKAILSLYPNTVTAECARSAAYCFWRYTCGLTGENIRKVVLSGSTNELEGNTRVKGNTEASGWFAPVFSGDVSRDKANISSSLAEFQNVTNDLRVLIGDRPVLYSVYVSLQIASDVLRDLWDRSSPQTNTNKNGEGATPIPFHRRVSAVEWALGIVRTVSDVHKSVLGIGECCDLRANNGDNDTCSRSQTAEKESGIEGKITSSPLPFTFAELLADRNESQSGTSPSLSTTSDLSARLASQLGELMDTLVDITSTVENSHLIRKRVCATSQKAQSENHASMMSNSSEKEKKDALTPVSASSVVAEEPPAADSLHEQIEKLSQALPLLLLETSGFFTRCVDHLLEFPAAVAPFTHMSVVDGVRAHHEMINSKYVQQSLHAPLVILGLGDPRLERQAADLSKTRVYRHPVSTCLLNNSSNHASHRYTISLRESLERDGLITKELEENRKEFEEDEEYAV